MASNREATSRMRRSISTEEHYPTTQLTCPASAGSNELQKAYRPAGSGAAPGSASGARRSVRLPRQGRLQLPVPVEPLGRSQHGPQSDHIPLRQVGLATADHHPALDGILTGRVEQGGGPPGRGVPAGLWGDGVPALPPADAHHLPVARLNAQVRLATAVERLNGLADLLPRRVRHRVMDGPVAAVVPGGVEGGDAPAIRRLLCPPHPRALRRRTPKLSGLTRQGQPG